MSETKFEASPPANGTRVEILSGKQPRPYVVRGWKDDQLVIEQVCQTKAEAEQYRSDLAKKLL